MGDLFPVEVRNEKSSTVGKESDGTVQITLGNVDVLTVKLLAEIRDLLVKNNQLLAAIAVKVEAVRKENG